MSKRNIDRIMTEARKAADAATRYDPAAEGERAAREDNRKARMRTKQVPGYRIQPKLPVNIYWFGAICQEADFTEYNDVGPCVEATVRLGLIEHPYTLVLSYEQALEADIIERI